VRANKIDECQPFGVIAQEARAVRCDAVDRAAEAGAVGKFVEIFEHGDLMRLGDFHTAEAEGPDAAHRVAEFLGIDLERHEPPIEPGQEERLLDHEMGRIAGDGAGDQAAFFDERGASHGRVRLLALENRRCISPPRGGPIILTFDPHPRNRIPAHVKAYSPPLFWLLAAATAAVDAVAFVWLYTMGAVSSVSFLYDALVTAQLAVLCTWCVFGARRAIWAWGAAIVGVAAAGAAEAAALPAGFVESCGFYGIFVVILIAVLWVVKRSTLWQRISGLPSQDWQFSMLQLLAAMTVVALLITALRHSEVLVAAPDLWKWVVVLSLADVILVTTTIFAWAWGTRRKSGQAHWLPRLGVALAVALVLGAFELFLMRLGALGQDLASYYQSGTISGMLAYLVKLTVVIFIWLELAPVITFDEPTDAVAQDVRGTTES
jgi:hypothetical protein